MKTKFLPGDIVVCWNVFGYVVNVQNGVLVRFPDPHRSDCFTEVKFHPSGRLFEYGGPVILMIAEDNRQTLDEKCRELTREKNYDH